MNNLMQAAPPVHDIAIWYICPWGLFILRACLSNNLITPRDETDTSSGYQIWKYSNSSHFHQQMEAKLSASNCYQLKENFWETKFIYF